MAWSCQKGLDHCAQCWEALRHLFLLFDLTLRALIEEQGSLADGPISIPELQDVIKLTYMDVFSLLQLAKQFLGRKVLVGWPYLREARVQAIADPFDHIHLDPTHSGVQNYHADKKLQVQGIYYWYRGIDVAQVDVLISVLIDDEKHEAVHPAQVSSINCVVVTELSIYPVV